MTGKKVSQMISVFAENRKKIVEKMENKELIRSPYILTS